MRIPRVQFTMRRMMVITAVSALAIGFATTYKNNQVYRPPAPSPAHAAVIEIAKKAVGSSTQGDDEEIYDASLVDGEWSVLVQRITGYDLLGHPRFTPGAHCLVLIDKDGKVLGIERKRGAEKGSELFRRSGKGVRTI